MLISITMQREFEKKSEIPEPSGGEIGPSELGRLELNALNLKIQPH